MRFAPLFQINQQYARVEVPIFGAHAELSYALQGTWNLNGAQQGPVKIGAPECRHTADYHNITVQIQYAINVARKEVLDPKPRPVVERVMGVRIERKQRFSRKREHPER